MRPWQFIYTPAIQNRQYCKCVKMSIRILSIANGIDDDVVQCGAGASVGNAESDELILNCMYSDTTGDAHCIDRCNEEYSNCVWTQCSDHGFCGDNKYEKQLDDDDTHSVVQHGQQEIANHSRKRRDKNLFTKGII